MDSTSSKRLLYAASTTESIRPRASTRSKRDDAAAAHETVPRSRSTHGVVRPTGELGGNEVRSTPVPRWQTRTLIRSIMVAAALGRNYPVFYPVCGDPLPARIVG